MKRPLLLLTLIIIFLGCENSEKLNPCLQALEIVSIDKFSNGEVVYEVIGELSDFSKGVSEFEDAVEQTLNLPEGTINSCLVFEENFPECFGYYVFDLRLSAHKSDIKLHTKVKVRLKQVKLDKMIPLSSRKQKDVQYIYIIQEIEELEK